MDPRRWETIRVAFDELVELDASARASRLAVLGATDPDLRAAVESMLAADAEADRRLAPIEASLVSPGADPRDRLAAALAGRYRVERELGSGGMATVYLAHDLKHDRPVALKVLRPELAAALGRERFGREVALTARLEHPHILPLLDSGEALGLVYYVMPYVEGESLHDRLEREKQLPLDEVLQITHEVADALSYAHRHGIVHRDIKPGNILLGGGHARVADFGIARAVTVAGGATLTEIGIAVGTPCYMSPEQARGEREVDGRSDIYSLACVVYEMLAGQPPYTGATPEAILARKSVEAVPSVRVVRKAVPVGVEQALTGALATVPADRFATAAEFATALQLGRDAQGRGTQLPRRGLRLALVLGTGLLVAGAAVVAIRSRNERAEALSRIVVMPFDNRTGDASLEPVGTIAADWVTQGLTEPGILVVLDTRSALAAARTLGAAATPMAVGRETGAGLVVAGSYFLRGDSLQFQAQIASTTDGRILFGIGDVAALRDRPLDGVVQLRQRVLGALASLHDRDVATFQTRLVQPPTYNAYREYTEGLEHYMRLDYAEAARHFERAAALDSTFLTARLWAAQSLWPGVANSTRGDSILAALGPLRDRLSPFDRARFDYVVSLRGAAFNLEDAYRAALRMVDAAPGSVDARREAALSALRVLRPRQALRLLKEFDPERGLMREWPLYWGAVAAAHHMLGEHEEELAAARRGQQLFPTTPLFYELRALAALGRVGELDSIARAEFPAVPDGAGATAFRIAGELLAHGHPEAALRLAHYALDLLATRPPADSAGARAKDEWLRQRADLALLLGDARTAAECVAQVHYPEEHRLLLARTLAAQGRHDAARAMFEETKRRVMQTDGPVGWLDQRIEAADVLLRLGDLDGALEELAGRLGTDPIFLGFRGHDGHADPELAPLWGNPRFRALIRPRG
jgi:tetratricopeptide (TPR) repeat protein